MPIVTPLKARLELDTSNYTKGVETAASGAKSLTAVTDGVAKKSSGSVTAMTGGIIGAFKTMGVIGGLAILGIVGGLISIATTLAALGVAILRWGIQMWDTLAASTRPFSAFHDQMLELQTAINGMRGAFYALFVNLLAAALPVIIPVIQWLTKLLNTLSMVFAALTGQKMVYQAITVAATQAGNAAKGALAGFDQLDVLANNNLLQFQQVPIDPAIVTQVDAFKAKMKELWDNVVTWARLAWQEVQMIWTNPRQFFADLWTWVVGFSVNAWTLTKNVWWVAATWFSNSVVGPIYLWFEGLWTNIRLGATIAYLNLLLVWISVASFFKLHITDPIGLLFKNMVNGIISALNGMLLAITAGINAVADGMNSIKFAIPGWIPGLGGMSFGLNIQHMLAPQIPQLAEGAVIPSNAPFMAMLGDQKSGTNIEAPANLIRSILQEEIGNIKADISLSFEGNLAALVRELKPHINKENVRLGNSLVKNTGMIQL